MENIKAIRREEGWEILVLIIQDILHTIVKNLIGEIIRLGYDNICTKFSVILFTASVFLLWFMLI